MPRLRPTPRALVVLSIAALFVACDDPPGTDEPATDAHPGRNDVGPCGPTPAVFCLPGAIGRTCGEGSVLMTCTGKLWQCPEGTVVPSDCGCRTDATDGGATLDAGDACPAKDAGIGDARDADADARADAPADVDGDVADASLDDG